MRVMIVEDNDANRNLISYLLRADDIEVTAARDGREALTMLEATTPEVVLCDIGMPVMNGYEFAQAVRVDPRWAAIRLIAVTAYSMPGDRDAAIAAGFDGYIPKPIEPESFARRIREFAISPRATGI